MSNPPPQPPPGSGGGWQPSGGGTQPGAGWQQQPYQQGPGGYGQGPGQMYPPPPAFPGRNLTIAAFVLAGLALILFPIVLGPVGVGLAVAGHNKGDPLAKWAIWAAAAATVIGMILGFVMLQAVGD